MAVILTRCQARWSRVTDQQSIIKYRQADAPGYLPGLWVTAALQLASIALLVPMSLYFAKKNRQVENGTTVLEGRPGFKYSI